MKFRVCTLVYVFVKSMLLTPVIVCIVFSNLEQHPRGCEVKGLLVNNGLFHMIVLCCLRESHGLA
jgi:hypothetical protein